MACLRQSWGPDGKSLAACITAAMALVLAPGACGGGSGSTNETATSASATGPGGTGGAGAGADGPGGAGGAPSGTTGSGGAGGNSKVHEDPYSSCDACLTNLCAKEEAACGDECVAVEACIQTFCRNLSKTASPDEGKCQVKCQEEHAPGKAQHLALVECATTVQDDATCFPPCTPFPQDHDACREVMLAAECADEKAACDASLGCKNFRDCVDFCETAASCFACDDEPDTDAGRKLYEALEQCIARECVTEAWIP